MGSVGQTTLNTEAATVTAEPLSAMDPVYLKLFLRSVLLDYLSHPIWQVPITSYCAQLRR